MAAAPGTAAPPSRAGWHPALHPAWLVVACSAWIGTVCNLALWRALARTDDLGGGQGVLLGLALAVMITSALAGLLGLLAWRSTLKPALTLLLLAAAFGAYFMLSYGVVIDATMITNVLQTDPRETRDLLNGRLVTHVLLLAVLPAALVWRWPVRRLRWGRQLAHNTLLLLASLAVLVLVLLASFQPLSSTMRNHKQLRYLINPLNSLYALGQVAAAPLQRGSTPLQALGTDARLGPSYTAQRKPPLLVLVLGETGRAGNFGINGYARPTTPELAREQIATLSNAWSCGTSTAASVPCMFSGLTRTEYIHDNHNAENLLDVIQRAGLAVLWLDNQAGCKGVCERVPHASTLSLQDPQLCGEGECLDEIMLRGLDERIAALPAERRAKGVVIVMHQMGSHGPAYFKRSPPAYKRFMPECASNALQDCSREQVVNAYDNTIAYTDHFLAATIAWLKASQDRAETAMLYVADHGESLGENNLYLHGLPYALAPDVQKHVPWIAWFSPGFEQRRQLSAACLQSQRDQRVSHDNYVHSVLGLLDIQTSVRKPALDLYSRCMAGG
ncbi:MAG TPA: phosphoethanolamine--lipid A transferase [Ideonella sp.]|nr:phosphoethanolamine--lipid A transferase [Ideonella sp.]